MPQNSVASHFSFNTKHIYIKLAVLFKLVTVPYKPRGPQELTPYFLQCIGTSSVPCMPSVIKFIVKDIVGTYSVKELYKVGKGCPQK